MILVSRTLPTYIYIYIYRYILGFKIEAKGYQVKIVRGTIANRDQRGYNILDQKKKIKKIWKV